MMIRSPRHQHNQRRVWSTLAVLATLTLILYWIPLPGFLGRVAQTISVPILRMETGVSNMFAPLGSYFLTKKYLSDEIHRLETERSELIRASLLNAYLLDENRKLKMALGRPDHTTHGVLAVVLAGPTRSPYDTFVLDIGSNSGVEVGGVVLSESGYALGTITSVSGKSSVATLFSSPGAETRVIIGTSSPNALRAVGHGGGSFEIQAPREVTVTKGDPVLIPAITALPLGGVEEVLANETSAYQSVLFGYPDNIFSIRRVIVTSPSAFPHTWEVQHEDTLPAPTP